jgi:phosphosulfolactate synthase
MTSVEHNREFVPPPRSTKPRKRGMTAVIDYGPDNLGWTGERGIADMLDCAAEYIDFVKIYAMNALLIPLPVIQRIVKLYRDAGVRCYAGGILFEYAYRRNEVDLYCEHVLKVGLDSLEISENYVTLNDNERLSFIDRFQRCGLSVIYEFGRKNPELPLRVEDIEALVTTMARHGVDHVIVEQSEIDMAASRAPERLKAIAAAPWFDHILIEADPFRFPKQHVGLLEDFGTDVNLANIAPGQALRLEGLRRGIGRAVDYALLSKEGMRV